MKMNASNNKMIFLFTVSAAMVVRIVAMTKPGCQSTCGDLTIPYPFGIGSGCYLEGFEISCNASKARWNSNSEIKNITLSPPQLRVLSNTDKTRGYSTVKDWWVGNQTCQAARAIADGDACISANSECVDSVNGPGYNCKCSDGYEGNPYLPDGCEDINECDFIHCHGTCTNKPGSYSCVCPSGSRGNATGDGCYPKGLPLYAKAVIGSTVGVFVLIIAISSAYWGVQKRKLIKAKQRFFEHNGGLFLQQRLTKGQSHNFKIYTSEELKKATNNFDAKQILGRGGNGIVYKGVLEDQATIAIKRSLMVDDKQSAEFANEMLILSQINHANVVKLLGCCLEVEVPILAYELVPGGTLFHYIHNRRPEVPFPWDLRLKIAIDSAKALSYLHNDASPTILHGDVKSSNILLDEQSKAKVSDFGTSTLARKDKYQFMTLVQGTYGYLDPECLQTCQLTFKSDVYSFGVVLAELITGKKALYKDGSEEEKSLAVSFTSCVKRNSLRDILDTDVADEDSLPQIQTVADIAVQCLSLRGDERPAMLDVFHELQALGRSGAHPWVTHDLDVTERLINWNPDTSTLDQTGNISICSYAMNIGGR